MATTPSQHQVIKFGVFEVDLAAGEIRKAGMKQKLAAQPFQLLQALLERPQKIVTREELRERLWPGNTFVDYDLALKKALNRVREVLGDSAGNPRFIETVPRRGYRFIAPLNGGYESSVSDSPEGVKPATTMAGTRRHRALRLFTAVGACVLLTGVGLIVYKRRSVARMPVQRALTRFTFDAGLQVGATWSPDGRYIAYSSDRGGKFDIWVQQVSGGDPVKVTRNPGQNWQPDWSPDGKYMTYRVEGSDAGLYVTPALGGAGLERRISSFGYFPRWSPDSSKILFQANPWTDGGRSFYLVGLDGSPPRQVLREFLEKNHVWARSAGWFPDGRKISFWMWNSSGNVYPNEPSFLTVTLPQETATKTELTAQLAAEMKKISLEGQPEYETDVRFSWAPSGDAVYFERTLRGAKNLWKLKVDPATFKAVGLERLTTDADLDTEFALSSDGKRIAFTAEAHDQRAWLFPFDAVRGRLMVQGNPITSPGEVVFLHTLTRDGRKLAFTALRAGHWELREKSLPDGEDSPIIADDYIRGFASWSPEGKRLAYWRGIPFQSGVQLFVWSADTRIEEPVADLSSFRNRIVYDWSADGKDLLVAEFSPQTKLFEIWRRPAAPLGPASPPAQKLVSDPEYDLWQAHLSPDEKWLVLAGTKNTETGVENRIFLSPGAGGGLVPLLDSGYWDDKPHWSPDGQTIYFLSNRSGFFNVWGIRFDLARGRTIGEPFRITRFDSPDLTVPRGQISCTELSLSRDRLVLNLSHRAGSVWILDDVDR